MPHPATSSLIVPPLFAALAPARKVLIAGAGGWLETVTTGPCAGVVRVAGDHREAIETGPSFDGRPATPLTVRMRPGEDDRMPRIRGASIGEHHELVWTDLAEAIGQLLQERDYDSINMGHIAARVGLARNTLYNYGSDKGTLVLALTERAGRPTVERVAAIAARSADPAAERMREIVGVVLEAFTDPTLQLMFRPGSGSPVAGAQKGPGGPFHAIVVEVERVVRDGVGRGEFRDVGDVRLAVELLSGVMRAGAERIGRDPVAVADTVRAAREIVLAALAHRRE